MSNAADITDLLRRLSKVIRNFANDIDRVCQLTEETLVTTGALEAGESHDSHENMMGNGEERRERNTNWSREPGTARKTPREKGRPGRWHTRITPENKEKLDAMKLTPLLEQVLSPSEQTIVRAMMILQRASDASSAEEICMITGHKNRISIAAQLSTLQSYGVIEHTRRGHYRLLSPEEMAGGVALKLAEKNFFKEVVWPLAKSEVDGIVKVSHMNAKTHLSDVTVYKFLKALTLAGYLVRPANGMRIGYHQVVRDPAGNPIERKDRRVEAKDVAQQLKDSRYFEPYQKRDPKTGKMITVYPEGYSGIKEKKDAPLPGFLDDTSILPDA